MVDLSAPLYAYIQLRFRSLVITIKHYNNGLSALKNFGYKFQYIYKNISKISYISAISKGSLTGVCLSVSVVCLSVPRIYADYAVAPVVPAAAAASVW